MRRTFREKWLGIWIIPLITICHYFLGHLLDHSNAPSTAALIVDTAEGYVVWYTGRFIWNTLKTQLSTTHHILKRLVIQLVVSSLLMLAAVAALMMLSNELLGNHPVAVHICTQNMLVIFTWILVFNVVYSIKTFSETNPGSSFDNVSIEVNSGTKILNIPSADILYLFAENNVTYLVDNLRKSHTASQSFRKLEMVLGDRFFKANRNYLISREAINSYHPVENGSINVAIDGPSGFPIEINIPRRHANGFRKWLCAA